MEYKYFPHTESEIKEMLDIVGVGSLDELYSDVPEEIRFKKEYDLPEAMSEMEVRRFFEALGNENKRLVCFAGAAFTTITRQPWWDVSCSALSSLHHILHTRQRYHRARSTTSSNISR